jgi:hypothetical protein
MIYIVTGLMRTGTSLMMQVLATAGIKPYYSKPYERRSRGGRLRNKAFLEDPQCIRGDIRQVPEGRCVKVFLNRMHKIDLVEGRHKVIAMWRPTVDRLRSTRQGMPKAEWRKYQRRCTHANVEVEQDYDKLKEQFPGHILVDFNELIDNPKVVLSRVSDYVELPQVAEAVSAVEPQRRHYNKGGS